MTTNNIVEAQKIINALHKQFNYHGVNFLLYGSVLRNGIGNDIDIVVLNNFRKRGIKEEIVSYLEAMGFGRTVDKEIDYAAIKLYRKTSPIEIQYLDIVFCVQEYDITPPHELLKKTNDNY